MAQNSLPFSESRMLVGVSSDTISLPVNAVHKQVEADLSTHTKPGHTGREVRLFWLLKLHVSIHGSYLHLFLKAIQFGFCLVEIPFRALKQSQLQLGRPPSPEEATASVHKAHTAPSRNKGFAHLKVLVLVKPLSYTAHLSCFI